MKKQTGWWWLAAVLLGLVVAFLLVVTAGAINAAGWHRTSVFLGIGVVLGLIGLFFSARNPDADTPKGIAGLITNNGVRDGWSIVGLAVSAAGVILCLASLVTLPR